ncbi:MAG: ATP-binding cassette domain-containing protein, partial [Candidatus Latescibacteria bacterium]|nr:ATP-binding cassette domain-containing protein [Candidatus Latescibacterota bacterium]
NSQQDTVDACPVISLESYTQQGDGGFLLTVPKFDVFPGKAYGISGSNGAGKTTLLKALALLTRPSTGSIHYDGRALMQARDFESARRAVTLVMQDAYLFRTTVLENVIYGLRVRNASKSEAVDRGMESLRAVGMEGFATRRADRLSRGETQRVAIARALALRPRVLLMDEPTASVDKPNIGLIEQIIQDIVSSHGTSVVFSTHETDQAYRLASDVVSMVEGVLLEAGPSNLFSGRVVRDDGGTHVLINDEVGIQVITHQEGAVHIRIPPEDIIVSSSALQSSARNSFPGIIVSAVLDENHIKLTLDVGVTLRVVITKQSFSDMGLTVQDSVFATFKTSAVQVY